MAILEHPARTAEPQAHPGPDSRPAPAVAERVLLELDPRTLLENPLNPREELGDVSAEAASMRECGVLEPLIVVPVDHAVGDADGDGAVGERRYMVMFGHRRRAAAIGAGLATVPCDVRPEYADRSAEQLADMLVENLHRRDLTAVEEAGGYTQLAMFEGWMPERIAGRLGRPVDRVRAGIAATQMPAELRPKVATGALTLEQAAAIEEFAGDEKAYARLVKAADYPPGLHYALADERQKRTVEERKVTTRTALRDARIRIIAKPKTFPWSSVEARVEDLTGPDGAYLTAETHASCPGHAAFVDAEGQPVYVCQHPKTGATAPHPAIRTAARPRSPKPRRQRPRCGSMNRRWRLPTRRGLRSSPSTSAGRASRRPARFGRR